MNTTQLECRRIPTSELQAQRQTDYVDTGLVSALRELMFGPNVVLRGPKGGGKSMAFEQLAALEGIPLLRQECCEETSVRDLVGTFSVQGDEVFFQEGALTTAIDVANEDGACLLVLEEVNTLPPMTQKILNPLMDYRRSIQVPKAGRAWHLLPDHNLWVCGTMNPNYAGTYGLNEDLRSRCEFIDVNYMPPEKEKEVLIKQFPSPPNALERKIVDQVVNLARETRSERMGYGLSTRDIVQFVRNMLLTKDRDRALKLLEGKFEGEHIQDFRARVMSVFNANLDTIRLY